MFSITNTVCILKEQLLDFKPKFVKYINSSLFLFQRYMLACYLQTAQF